MDPSSFDYDKYHKKCEEINRMAPKFAAGEFLPVMQWTLGNGIYSYNSKDKKQMLETMLAGITETLNAKNDQLPHLEPWHGIGVFAEAFGTPFEWVADDAPWTRTIVHDIDGLRRIEKPDIKKAGLLQRVLETTEYFNDQTRGEISIAATDTQGPLSTMSLICDTTWMLTEAWDYPEEFHRVLGDITDLIIEFTLMQRNCCSRPAMPGHTMWSPGISSGISLSDDMLALVDSDFYAEFGLPYDEKIGKALGGVGIHSCGQWYHNFEIVKKLESIMMIDLAVSYDWDFAPQDTRKIAKAFAGERLPVQARCKPEDRESIDILLRSDMKTILSFWWSDDPEIRNRNYDEVKARWEVYNSL